MKLITLASLLSLATVVLAQPSATPDEQNVAVVEDAQDSVDKDSRSTEDSLDFEDFWTKMMADLPKKKDPKGDKKKPKFDFGKILGDIMGDLKKDGGGKNADLEGLFKDMKGLDIKSLLDDLLKKPEKEGEKLEV